MEKSAIRAEMRRLKAACSPKERDALSRAVIARLEATPQWQQAKTVLLYHSLPDEVATHDLIRRATTIGKRVLLPVVEGDDLLLRSYQPSDELHEGAFHIFEPTGETFTDYAAIDLAVIPGVAFTPDGFRLGRGRGYYDRLLPHLIATCKIGICWPFQLLSELPTEPHDVRMDAVITIVETPPIC